jgi:DNA-binding PadR family transcriptional regulator
MNAENVKSQMRKGTLEYCILLLLKKEPAYTSDIIQKLQEAKLIVVEGTLYPLLTRLKNSELSVDRIYARTATQVLPTDRERRTIPRRAGGFMAGTK